MGETPNVRQERIERLLKELQYEVTRGVLEKDVPEEMGFRFYVPRSDKIPDGVVACEFRTRPVHRHQMSPDLMEPRLKLVRS